MREVTPIELSLDDLMLKVRESLWMLGDKRIALLGLAYKPETEDVRSSPSLALARQLLDAGGSVVGYDPEAGQAARAEIPGLDLASDPYEAVTDAHCVIVCTRREDLRKLDLALLRKLVAYPVIIDGPNLFDPEEMRAADFIYYPKGRPPILNAHPGE